MTASIVLYSRREIAADVQAALAATSDVTGRDLQVLATRIVAWVDGAILAKAR